MKLDPIAGLKKMRQDKREWRAHDARVKALPPDYRMVMEEIEKYLFNFATDSSIITAFYDILDLMEEGAASGRPVLEVTGDDVAGFAQNVLAAVQSKTWQANKAAQLNARIHDKLDQGES